MTYCQPFLMGQMILDHGIWVHYTRSENKRTIT